MIRTQAWDLSGTGRAPWGRLAELLPPPTPWMLVSGRDIRSQNRAYVRLECCIIPRLLLCITHPSPGK